MDPREQQPNSTGYNQQPQPAAYDTEGRPLYHHPPLSQAVPSMQQASPPPPPPQGIEHDGHHGPLNLSKNEVLLREVKRHPIVAFGIWASGIFILLAIIALAVILYATTTNPTEGIITEQAMPTIPPIAIILGAFCLGVLVIIFTLIGLRVNAGNRFYITNESVIQRIQNSIFHIQNQQISLLNIEDVTFEKHGLFAHMLDYGTVRMSTEGDETTYLFKYTPHPKEVANHIINTQESHTETMNHLKIRH